MPKVVESVYNLSENNLVARVEHLSPRVNNVVATKYKWGTDEIIETYFLIEDCAPEFSQTMIQQIGNDNQLKGAFCSFHSGSNSPDAYYVAFSCDSFPYSTISDLKSISTVIGAKMSLGGMMIYHAYVIMVNQENLDALKTYFERIGLPRLYNNLAIAVSERDPNKIFIVIKNGAYWAHLVSHPQEV